MDDGSVLSVDASGTVTALATHWAKALVEVSNKCRTSVQTVSVFVNPTASASAPLDLGEKQSTGEKTSKPHR